MKAHEKRGVWRSAVGGMAKAGATSERGEGEGWEQDGRGGECRDRHSSTMCRRERRGGVSGQRQVGRDWPLGVAPIKRRELAARR